MSWYTTDMQRWLAAFCVFAALGMRATVVDACSCAIDPRIPAEAGSDVAFVGVAIEKEYDGPGRETASRCAQPQPLPAEALGATNGCLVVVVQEGCHRLADATVTVHPEVVRPAGKLTGSTGVARFCGLAGETVSVFAFYGDYDTSHRMQVSADTPTTWVAQIDFSHGPTNGRAKLHVVEPIKNAKVGEEHWVYYWSDGAMCGFGDFELGVLYAVYADRTFSRTTGSAFAPNVAEQEHGRLSVSMCSRSHPLYRAEFVTPRGPLPTSTGCAHCAVGTRASAADHHAPVGWALFAVFCSLLRLSFRRRP